MKTCAVVAYVPPNAPPWYPEQFMENLRNNKPNSPLLLYSDSHARPDVAVIPRISGSSKNPVAANNMVWMYGVQQAARHGVDYFIYLESDCRVMGNGWDSVMLSEFFSDPNWENFYMAGTVVCSTVDQNDQFGQASERFKLDDSDPLSKHMPLYVSKETQVGKNGTNCVFVNGALGLYQTHMMSEIWEVGKDTTHEYMLSISGNRRAWDWHGGIVLTTAMGMGVLDRIKQMRSVCSGAGEKRSTEAERIQLLLNKSVVGIHQVKSAWTI